MKTQIGSPLLNKQDNAISRNTRKPKGHKEHLGLRTLTLNQGISSQGSGLRDICHKWQTFFKNRPEDRNDPQPDPSVQPKARGLLHMEREFIMHHIKKIWGLSTS